MPDAALTQIAAKIYGKDVNGTINGTTFTVSTDKWPYKALFDTPRESWSQMLIYPIKEPGAVRKRVDKITRRN